MSVTFTKLFSSITESTVWCEPDHVRILWITMLAMSDRNGRVWGSIPGLANRARIPVEQARDAINRFLSPDPDSRTPTNEGRRVEPIDGGWRLLNHEKYRALRDEEERRVYKADWIKQQRQKTNVDNVDTCRPPSSNTEAEADTEADTKDLKPLASSDKSLSAGKQAKIILTIPINGGVEFGVDETFAAELSELYPAVDMPQTLREIRAWNLANPKLRKTAGGIKRHINSWFAKEQNRG